MVLAVVKRNTHVVVAGVNIGRVFTEHHGTRQWVAYTVQGEPLKALDTQLLFRTRYLAVRALIEASEELLTKEQPLEK